MKDVWKRKLQYPVFMLEEVVGRGNTGGVNQGVRR